MSSLPQKQGCLGARLQQGFAAVAAIFLVVLLAALGSFMVSFSNTQQVTSAQDVTGSRAYWAARAGLEWAAVAVPPAPSLCPSTVLAAIGAAPPAFTPVVPSPLDGFLLVVRCAKNTYTDGGTTRTIFRFESTARSAGAVGSIGYTERSISASMEQ